MPVGDVWGNSWLSSWGLSWGQGDAVPEGAASEYPANICMRSGRITPPWMLVKEWTGLWVRPEHLDWRHPQEFVRGKTDRQRVPDPRPESADTFLSPNEVTRDDL